MIRSRFAALTRAFATRRLPAMVLALALLTSCGALVARAAVPAGSGSDRAPEMVTDTTVIQPSEDLSWHVPALVRNHLSIGLYFDSLIVEIEHLGKIDPGANRIERSDLSGIVRAIGSVGAGESQSFEFIQPAIAERARLTFRLYAHDAVQQPRVMTMVVEAEPGELWREHPSRLLEVGGRKVEYLALPPPGGQRPAPAVLLIHGHGASARPMIRAARLLSARGWWVALLSQPGYGASDGPADLMGPATLAAAEAALAELTKTEGVDPRRIAVWGFSRGATVAALLATRHPELKALVAQSGIYDLWATSRGTTLGGFREAIVAEAGTDSAAWGARSPLLQAKGLKVPTLVIHGGRDLQVPAAQASAFATAIQAGGGSAEARVLPTAGHLLSPVSTTRPAVEFLTRQFGP